MVMWIISKVIGFLAKTFLGRLAKQNGGRFRYQKSYTYGNREHKSQSKDVEGRVNVDHVPKQSKSKYDDFKGGDYVDYEEVK